MTWSSSIDANLAKTPGCLSFTHEVWKFDGKKYVKSSSKMVY